VIICVLIGGYQSIEEIIEKQKLSIFVSPKEYIVGAGREEVFTMKLINNKDIPLYNVGILLEIVSGDLTTNQIKIEPLDESKVTSYLGDKKGGVEVVFDIIQFHGIPQGSTKKEPTLIDIKINNIDPNATKNYKLSINSKKIKESSTINLKVGGFSEKPTPIISW
jgi:hypothetical protein